MLKACGDEKNISVAVQHEKTQFSLGPTSTDQFLCCLYEEILSPYLPTDHTAKTDLSLHWSSLIVPLVHKKKCVKMLIFSYPSVLTHVLDAH